MLRNQHQFWNSGVLAPLVIHELRRGDSNGNWLGNSLQWGIPAFNPAGGDNIKEAFQIKHLRQWWSCLHRLYVRSVFKSFSGLKGALSGVREDFMLKHSTSAKLSWPHNSDQSYLEKVIWSLHGNSWGVYLSDKGSAMRSVTVNRTILRYSESED